MKYLLAVKCESIFFDFSFINFTSSISSPEDGKKYLCDVTFFVSFSNHAV